MLRQDYPTSDMAHKIPRVVEWASSVATLEPGDVIATGTNHQGLGALQDGDVMEMEIEGLGRLSGIKVTDAKKRSWSRETRAQKAAREATAGRAST
ncbi:MAG TPA: fumarylacetoacetate hydrolase family protein [Dehalococcoidia bacterium]|nr:fumarylacetoacetate hydrolase family protein [Dehalococcoidia bacterium]